MCIRDRDMINYAIFALIKIDEQKK